MNDLLPQGLQHHLALADGSRWVIVVGDQEAASVVLQLADAMQLSVMSPSAPVLPGTFGTSGVYAVEPPHRGPVHRLLVLVDRCDLGKSQGTRHAPSPFEEDGAVVCVLRPCANSDGLDIRPMELSLIFARDAQTRGGVLLHGALAEKDGLGVILAAPGGTGKTTASERLLAPWRSLCDDTTLVVRNSHGSYWAHPWPTWSRFKRRESMGTWDVQHAVPLGGIFFLSKAVENRVESVGPGHAVSLLVECAGQSSQLMARGLSIEETRALHLERFNNLCAFAAVVPTHVLHISLTGAFWQEIEQALAGSRHGGR